MGLLYYFYNGIGGQFTRRLEGYFGFFIMAEVGSLDTYLGGLLWSIFIMTEVSNLWKITYLTIIMVRVVELMARCFWFLW